MPQDPLAFTSFTFDDSNAFRWGASSSDPLGPNVTIAVEKDAPYTVRSLTVPKTMTQKEMRAFVEAAVSIPQRGKAQAIRPPKKKTDTLKGLPKKDGNAWVVLVLLGLLALSSKKGR